MKKNRKVFVIIFSFVLLINSITFVYASTSLNSQRIEIIESNVETFLIEINVEDTIINYTILKNFGGENEAIYFYLSNQGYVVASFKDGHIIEYSPTGILSISTKSNTDFYYGGPGSFYIKEKDKFINLTTNDICTPATQYYSTAFVTTNQLYSNCRTASATNNDLLPTPINYLIADTYYCTITAITNLLQYYKDFYGSDVYLGAISNAMNLRASLNTNGYIYNGPLSFSNAVTSHTVNNITYTGLDSYFNRPDVSYHIAVVSYAVCSDIRALIESSFPVMVTVPTSTISEGATSAHAVLCYGYWETSMATYYIVNDTWGHNSVYICAEDVPENYEIIFLI